MQGPGCSLNKRYACSALNPWALERCALIEFNDAFLIFSPHLGHVEGQDVIGGPELPRKDFASV